MEGAFNKVNAADMLERKIGFSLPSDYKDFLRQHPDGAIYYPKVIQKGKEFFSFCVFLSRCTSNASDAQN